MMSPLITVLATAMAFFKDHWEELCQDIETGTLCELTTDGSAREAVSKILSPDPELANRVRHECSKESWAGILIRLWPNLRYICAISTGALLQYVQHFEFFTDNKVKIMSPVYTASEGSFAFAPRPETHPKDASYVFHPEMGFFEFLRLEDSTLIELADVKEGEDYEVVCTNLSGLWRYRMGDILKCTGYYHSSPEFQFVGRDNLLISVGHEAVYEYEITRAVESAARAQLLPDAMLVDYTTTVNVEEIPGRYVVFWEIEIKQKKAKIWTEDKTLETLPDNLRESLKQCCLAIENSLNDKYRRERNVGVIAALELILVKPGTFSQLHKEAQDTRARNQLKQPRTQKPDNPSVQLLYLAAKATFRSPSVPKSASVDE